MNEWMNENHLERRLRVGLLSGKEKNIKIIRGCGDKSIESRYDKGFVDGDE